MTVWLFVITLVVPSFGGLVTVILGTPDAAGCSHLRRAAVQQLALMQSTAVVGECVPAPEGFVFLTPTLPPDPPARLEPKPRQEQ